MGHVCQTAGMCFTIPSDCNMVLIGIDTEVQLSILQSYLESLNIKFCTFYEPDSADSSHIPMGVTALCTEPLEKSHRKHFNKYKLWTV